MLVVWEQINAFYIVGFAGANQKPHLCPSGGMVDAEVSKTSTIGCVGSSPTLGTILARKLFAIIVNKWYG